MAVGIGGMCSWKWHITLQAVLEILPKLCKIPKFQRLIDAMLELYGSCASLRNDVKPHLEAGRETTLLVKVSRARRTRQKRPSKGPVKK